MAGIGKLHFDAFWGFMFAFRWVPIQKALLHDNISPRRPLFPCLNSCQMNSQMYSALCDIIEITTKSAIWALHLLAHLGAEAKGLPLSQVVCADIVAGFS